MTEIINLHGNFAAMTIAEQERVLWSEANKSMDFQFPGSELILSLKSFSMHQFGAASSLFLRHYPTNISLQ
jgi:hypothetical protein